MPSAVEIEPKSDRRSTNDTNDDNSSSYTNQQYSEKEWDAMYPHIVRLYLGEQLTLGEVMRIMEVRHHFKATQSMYKKRISKWQLHKYKRRARSVAEPTPSIETADSPAARRTSSIARRPPSASLPPQVAKLETDSTVQALLTNMRRLSLMHNAPIRNPPGVQPDSEVGLTPSGIIGVSQLYLAFALGSTLFARGHGQLAGKAVRKAFLMLEDIIKNAHFGLDWVIIDLLYDFASRGQHELFSAFVAHLANLAHVLLPHHHPLHQIAEQLLRYGNDERGDIITLLQRVYYHQIDAVQSDPEVRELMISQNRPVRDALMTQENLDADTALVIRGIRAMQDEIERQKALSSPSSPASSPGRSPPSTTVFSHTGDSEGRDMMLLPKFVKERVKRSMARMNDNPDPLVLGVADRLYFTEYSPDLVDLYKLKGTVRQSELEGDWFGAIQAQRVFIGIIKDKWAADQLCLIRELWALMRLLESAGVEQAQIDAVNFEALEVARDLLKDIPDDAP
ncbi:Clr5 domain-containing protein [Xylariaceae sp. FL1272]|nr:Clr5 domain-containing protein [Xylariaceae sp. FL1272]